MVVIVITVAVRGPGVEYELKGDPTQRWTFLESGFFEAIGVISFAFVVSNVPNHGMTKLQVLTTRFVMFPVPPQLAYATARLAPPPTSSLCGANTAPAPPPPTQYSFTALSARPRSTASPGSRTSRR